VRGYCTIVTKLRVEGLGNIPRNTGAIIVANHRSTLDGFLLYSLMEKRIYSFIKRDYFKNPILGWYLKGCGGIPIKKGELQPSAIREAKKALRGTGILMVFPEGRVNEEASLLPFEDTFMRLSLEYHIPIIPVIIIGTEKALPDGKLFPKPSEIFVIVKEPLRFQCPLHRKDLIRSCVEQVRNVIAETLKNFPDSSCR
jgi:1-acyl-sn-glycerol-3-phosphate acyltransferase